MESVLRQIETEDSIFFVENQYYQIDIQKYKDKFLKLQKKGIISKKTKYTDSKWQCFSETDTQLISLIYNDISYCQHLKSLLKISSAELNKMLRAYAVSLFGVFVLSTIAVYLNSVVNFINHYYEPDFFMNSDDAHRVIDFLEFINFPEQDLNTLLKRVKIEKVVKSHEPRKLANLINYLAVSNEIQDIYMDENLSDEEFIYWFPIFFWTQITFVIPLRATEMLTTRSNCIERKNGDVFIHLWRTKLKKGNRNVYYNVDQDYTEFTYRIPDSHTVKVIEKYQNLTKSNERKFLFTTSDLMPNHIFPLDSFNARLEQFVDERLIGNTKYDYAKFASGIDDFERITAGDSRPIAMANLYYQDLGADICKQLANHERISTSAGYYTNVSNTVLASSIIQMQRKINYEASQNKKYEGTISLRPYGNEYCDSPKRPLETGNVEDCVSEGHLQECLGCRFYRPSEAKLVEDMKKREVKLDEASKRVIEFINKKGKKKDSKEDFDKLFLDAHTGIQRFHTACDEKAKEEEIKWRRRKNTQTNN